MNGSLEAFLEALGYTEEPFGMFYSDTEPKGGFVPNEGAPFSYEMEQRGELDTSALFRNWSCVMVNIWLARKKKTAAYFEAKRFGCVGGSFYLGFHKPQLEFISRYVSTGIPGKIPGERYLSPEVTRRFFNEIDPRPAPARFCVFKPVSRFGESEEPEVVTFFARGEVMAGLCTLATFVTEDFEAVCSPFGAGCSYMVNQARAGEARIPVPAVEVVVAGHVPVGVVARVHAVDCNRRRGRAAARPALSYRPSTTTRIRARLLGGLFLAGESP